MNELIIDKLKENKQLQNNIKLDDLEYTTKNANIMLSVTIHYLLHFKGYKRGKFVIRRC